MTQLSKVKAYENIQTNRATLNNKKRQTHGPTRLYELFLLTVPIEEVARWQYKSYENIPS